MGTANIQLMSYNVSVSPEQQQVCSQLQKLVLDLASKPADVDILEAHLDKVIQEVLKAVHGSELLTEQEVLQKELSGLAASVTAANAAADPATSQLFSLALNSLQRLHANLLRSDTEEEDGGAEERGAGLVDVGEMDEDDDDDDCFFMPMPGAVKWADEKKFSSLARPIGPDLKEQGDQFVLVMEPEEPEPGSTLLSSETNLPSSSLSPASADPAHPASSAAQCSEARSAQSLVDEIARDMLNAQMASGMISSSIAEDGQAQDEERLSPPQAAGQSSTADAPSPPEGPPHTHPANGATPAEEAATPSSAHTPQHAQPSTATGTAGAAPAAAAAAAVVAAGGVVAEQGAEVAAAGATDKPEKLKQFVTFLNGENPGACMFHAQMRLSVEGCVKLANFLKDSHRVRALSLSHNYLGDEGLRLICEGLAQNKSVTALDLPDNALGDQGMVYLVAAVKNNPSLTQLQLAYNSIGDKGAIALAEIIRTSTSLKKLGLSFNRIGKEGCRALTSAISANQSLKQLQILPGNPVEEKDAKALAKALKRNTKFSIRTFLGIGA
ncbi:MAG: hypothetical protein WDW36_000639 [Sanguina aurantia]